MKLKCTLLLLFVGLQLYGQEAPGLKDIIVDSASYLPVNKYRAIGLSYRNTRDLALSPLLFKGGGLSYSASSWKYNNHWLWQSSFTGLAHILQNEVGSSSLSEIGFRYHLAALRELQDLQKGPWRFWLGPEAGMLLFTRLIGRVFFHKGFFTACPAKEQEKDKVQELLFHCFLEG